MLVTGNFNSCTRGKARICICIFGFITICFGINGYLKWRRRGSLGNLTVYELSLEAQRQIDQFLIDEDNFKEKYVAIRDTLSVPLKQNDIKPNIRVIKEFSTYADCLKNASEFYSKNVSLHGKLNVFSEAEEYFRSNCFKLIGVDTLDKSCPWNTTILTGPLHVNMTPITMQHLYEKELHHVREGGSWRPENCQPRRKVAIIIPFRDRESHLAILLRQLHPMLKRQNLQYRIMVIEQLDHYPFNRGKLMNVGFKESLKVEDFDCFVFHDVDLIPENDHNDYGCPASPEHLSVAIDSMGYTLPYTNLFGGIEMFTRQHYELANGFPNTYWGWGAEDDDLFKRIQEKGLRLHRPSLGIARYKMAPHFKAAKAPTRYEKLREAVKNMAADGINNLNYNVIDVVKYNLFTLVQVNLQMEKDIRH